MNRSKRIFLLLGVLAAVCLVTFCVSRYQEHQEQIKTTAEIILEIPEDTVETLSWTYEDESFAFHRDGNWIYDEDEAFPVDGDGISALLEPFQALGAAFIIESVEDYGQYGLDDPQCTITLTTAEASYEIEVGDYSAMDAQRYVSIGDGNVYLVEQDPLEVYDVTLSDLIDNDDLPYLGAADKLEFSGGEELTILYDEEGGSYRSEDRYYLQREGEALPLDTGRVEDYFYTLGSVALTDYMTYTATEEDLTLYGLDDPELTVRAEYTEEDDEGNEVARTLSLAVSRSPEQRAAETDSEEEIVAYARVGDSAIIYQISASDYEALMACSYDDLRHTEILPAELEDVSRVDVTLDGETYAITAREEDGELIFSYQDEDLETTDFGDALSALTAQSFTDQQPDQQEEISLTVYLDLEGEPAVSIRLCRYDGESCLAEVDGQPVALVARSQVVDLTEAVYAIVLGGQ